MYRKAHIRHKYQQLFGADFAAVVKADNNVRAKLSYLGMQTKQHHVPLYLFIDKYDNYCFAKDGLGKSRVLNSNMVLYYLSNPVAQRPCTRRDGRPNAIITGTGT